MLFSLHTIAAAMLKTPEIALEKSEAEQVASAMAGVSRHYPIMQQSEKAIDWFNFCAVLGMVYGTRIVAIRAKWNTENAVKSFTTDNINAATDALKTKFPHAVHP